ncbi:glycyl radical protein [Anaerostipes sp.]|uniref:glycyl radical protein n=1 Tax=Anaerostipes sp. TaxID=1872530 RepID=UPI0025BADE0A|nr:formate C-acetyltransferase/glycerol dehydratase family glycyl radical enzyme [Anaerostipes sp.]MBS7008655.1 formate C-acetyltransferase/glycerol dehydratase family glycyl radical enzyme [Anaerostipes sp.]
MNELFQTERVTYLKDKMLSEPRYASIEQALIITESYRKNEDKPRIIQRALALKASLENIGISAEPEELIVGNRTAGVRYGVVFPESGSTWVDREFETLPTRPQDKFNVHPEDIDTFRKIIKPYWEGKSLEDVLNKRYGKEIDEIAKVVKINQKDHAQGHICPNCTEWLRLGPAGLEEQARKKLQTCGKDQSDFYESVILVMEGVKKFMVRYYDFIMSMAETEKNEDKRKSMVQVAENCRKLSSHPAETFHEAVQSVWFLFVVLQMESNASSFSPGRLDRHLIPYYEKDIKDGKLTKQDALEIIECMWLKFNEIVYMRNSHGAKYFAGFPIGFNIAVGGQDEEGNDYSNDLSFLFLQAQKHLGLPQPNLSVRLHEGTGDELLHEAVRVVAKGSGMPQFFNDKAVIPSIMELGIEEKDAMDYAVVGCVELTTQGNNLGWSDSAMFNLNKALEVAMTGGTCLLTGEKIAPDFGNLETYETFEQLEAAFQKQIDYFMDKMILACEEVEKAHIDLLPSPFLSASIDECMEKGMDVTAGGAKYNLSGIQMIQVANLADSLAAVKKLVYDEKKVSRKELLDALKNDFEGYEILRTMMLYKVPKYGNDVDWVDAMGTKWADYFKNRLRTFTNYRGGPYHTGMYTVSAHVPMGENVGATPDGRHALEPLADGGMSPVYGRDVTGPTAVLKSVSKLDKTLTTNGGLLNMKFLPEFFQNETGIKKFGSFLRSFVDLEIPHIQFNVVRKEDLIAAKEHPEQYRGLTVRVAGYTAYFTELADELQNEIIARTSYGDI